MNGIAFILKKHRCSLFIALLVTSAIVIIKFTDYRIGYSSKADSINTTIENLAFSYLVAYLFYLINDLIPAITQIKITRNSISNQLYNIHKNLRQIINSIGPFNINNNWYTWESFSKAFEKTDLTILRKNTKDILQKAYVISTIFISWYSYQRRT